MEKITIVGGGLAGLVSAISVAEVGGRVTLHEAAPVLGGRARTAKGPYRTNLGPHALYRHGAFETWLHERELLPPVGFPKLTSFRLRAGGRLRRIPLPLLPAMRSAREVAPIEVDYRSWATPRMGVRAAEVAIGFASLPTLHADPGRLSAAFVQERIRRSLVRRPVYYVLGGWARLVQALERRASEQGVEIVTRSKLAALPAGPTIVATDLPAAARLLEEPDLCWPGPRTAMLDVALRRARRDPSAVLDVDLRVYVSRYSAGDATLAPSGESLLQAHTGIRDDESHRDAIQRIERVLDAGFPRWRERCVWRQQGKVDGGAGPADPPGCDWRDRPAIDRGSGRWLAGDRVAAPGVLGEVSFESARIAARSVADKVLGCTLP